MMFWYLVVGVLASYRHGVCIGGASVERSRRGGFVTTLDETERTARRVLGGDHPLAAAIEYDLQNAQAALRARETPSTSV